jgi:hypothetical protein
MKNRMSCLIVACLAVWVLAILPAHAFTVPKDKGFITLVPEKGDTYWGVCTQIVGSGALPAAYRGASVAESVENCQATALRNSTGVEWIDYLSLSPMEQAKLFVAGQEYVFPLRHDRLTAFLSTGSLLGESSAAQNAFSSVITVLREGLTSMKEAFTSLQTEITARMDRMEIAAATQIQQVKSIETRMTRLETNRQQAGEISTLKTAPLGWDDRSVFENIGSFLDRRAEMFGWSASYGILTAAILAALLVILLVALVLARRLDAKLSKAAESLIESTEDTIQKVNVSREKIDKHHGAIHSLRAGKSNTWVIFEDELPRLTEEDSQRGGTTHIAINDEEGYTHFFYLTGEWHPGKENPERWVPKVLGKDGSTLDGTARNLKDHLRRFAQNGKPKAA